MGILLNFPFDEYPHCGFHSQISQLGCPGLYIQISLPITFLFFVEWRHSSSWRKQLSTSRNEKYYLGGRYSRGCIYSCPIYSKQARRNLQQVSELHFLHLQYKTTCFVSFDTFSFHSLMHVTDWVPTFISAAGETYYICISRKLSISNP